MVLVNDLDPVPGFTNRHTAIRAPEMFDHAILSDPETPLRTRIFLRLRNSLPFLFEISGREHPGWLLFGLAGVNAGFFRHCRVAGTVFFWRCPLVILVKDSKLLAALTKHEAVVGGPDILIYAILAKRKKVSCSFCTVMPEEIFWSVEGSHLPGRNRYSRQRPAPDRVALCTRKLLQARLSYIVTGDPLKAEATWRLWDGSS
jgi:hypothetical protein